ncbi:MAG: phosphopantetheine-binding protein [Bryobacterales bacterium]
MSNVAESVAARVMRVIAETQRIPEDSFTADSTFEEMKVDSLDGINIVFAVETEFDITVPDESVKDLRGVRDVINGVERLLAEKAAQPEPASVAAP